MIGPDGESPEDPAARGLYQGCLIMLLLIGIVVGIVVLLYRIFAAAQRALDVNCVEIVSPATAPRGQSADEGNAATGSSPDVEKQICTINVNVSAVMITSVGYLGLVTVMSCVSFALYGFDKRRAALAGRRVPERTLHLAALLGGWPGAWLGQQHFRHKTKKVSFLVLFWLTVFLHVAIAGALAYGFARSSPVAAGEGI